MWALKNLQNKLTEDLGAYELLITESDREIRQEESKAKPDKSIVKMLEDMAEYSHTMFDLTGGTVAQLEANFQDISVRKAIRESKVLEDLTGTDN